MDAPAPSPRTALIVHAHPEPASFSSAQMLEARAVLERTGYEVAVRDLYAEGWTPVLDRDEFPPSLGPFKPQAAQMRATRAGALAPDVRSALDALLSADLLVLSFPLWWFSVPAVLKGWLDRVLVMGAVFGGDLGLFDRAALRGRRAVLLVTTGGAAEAFRPDGAFGDIDAFLFPLHRGTLEFVGYDVLEPVITYGPAHLDDEARRRSLGAVHEAFSTLDGRDGYRRPGLGRVASRA
ncbi:NAD(P)H-dependent oxidoreductase [Patulibacter sp. S7RM1-6]